MASPLSRVASSLKSAAPSSFRSLIIAENDAAVFSIAHPKKLPLFASPLVPAAERRGSTESSDDIIECSQGSYTKEREFLEVVEGEPPLKIAHEANTVQLFFDLFFVANLTTFTTVHEINDIGTLKSYIGFFGILWFTWLQIALFDIRFGTDSFFERFCKALQFGIMTGLAIVGPGYKTGWESEDKEAAKAVRAFRTLSIILMLSRLILVGQYTMILIYLRDFKKVFFPLLVHIGVLFATSAIYLGVFFTFTEASGAHALPVWYATIGLEAGAILLVSGRYNFLSFRRTCIVERLGLLTLIILGEGIIGLCGSIQKVGNDTFTADIIGMVICGVVIIYCLWMLYFDQTEHERVGTVRQQIWTMMHFPYHVSILLVVEGTAQLSVWRKLIDSMWTLNASFNQAPSGNITETISFLNNTLNVFYEPFEEDLKGLKLQLPDLNPYFANLKEAFANQDSEAATTAMSNIFASGITFAAKNFGVQPPESTDKDTDLDVMNGLSNTFNTVFVYFFFCAGLAIILSGVLFLLGKRHRVRGDWLNMSFRFVVGTSILLLSVMGMAPAGSAASNMGLSFGLSPWMLPTVAIIYTIVVLVDNLLISYARRLVAQAPLFYGSEA